MKIDDVLDLLCLVDNKGWEIDKSGFIRDQNGKCPICSLLDFTHGAPYAVAPFLQWETVFGEMSKAERFVVLEIAEAADYPSHKCREKLRNALRMTDAAA